MRVGIEVVQTELGQRWLRETLIRARKAGLAVELGGPQVLFCDPKREYASVKTTSRQDGERR